MRLIRFITATSTAIIGANAVEGVLQLYEHNGYKGDAEGWGTAKDIVDVGKAQCVTHDADFGISSIKLAPIEGVRWACRLYKENDCTGQELWVERSLSFLSQKTVFTNVRPGWNDVVQSVKCFTLL